MNYRILIVEDEPKLREVLCDLMHSRGDIPTQACNGIEALEKIGEQEFDAVLLDIMMPGLSGTEACREIRSFSTIPLLFLTAKGTMDDKAVGYGSGGDDYLVKPFSQSELLMKVESLTRRYRVYKGKKETMETSKLVNFTQEDYDALYAALVATETVVVDGVETTVPAIVIPNDTAAASADALTTEIVKVTVIG